MKVKVSASLAVVDAQTPAPSDPRIRWLEQDSFMRQQQRQREREGALQVSACLRDLALKRRERGRNFRDWFPGSREAEPARDAAVRQQAMQRQQQPQQ